MKVIIVFMIVIFVLAALVSARVMMSDKSRDEETDRQYFDEEGNHTYYDRSLIEKREFHLLHPLERGVRTFRRLFSRLRN